MGKPLTDFKKMKASLSASLGENLGEMLEALHARITAEKPDNQNWDSAPYPLTATLATVDLGNIAEYEIEEDGQYQFEILLQIDNVGATFAASRKITIELWQNAEGPAYTYIELETGVTTTETKTLGHFFIRGDTFFNEGEVMTLKAKVSTLPSAGSVQITFASLKISRTSVDPFSD